MIKDVGPEAERRKWNRVDFQDTSAQAFRMRLVWISLLGGAGAGCRYLVDRALEGAVKPFPLSTLLINIVGSLAIGCLFVLGTEKTVIDRDFAALLSTGFIGGFTTFSAYALQVVLLMKDGESLYALTYFLLSPPAAVAAAFAGVSLARALVT